MNDEIRGAKCLVLGAGGFIGINLCAALVKLGASVTGFGHRPRYQAAVLPQDFISANLSTDELLKAAVSESDIVFHLIGGADPTGSNNHPAKTLEMELSSSLRLMKLCYEAKTKLVFTSSGGTVYGHSVTDLIREDHPTDPTSAYGVAKLCIEKSMQLYGGLFGLDYVILRLANPYGPFQSPHRGQGIVPKLIIRAITGQPAEIWGDGCATRDYLYIDDVIAALIASSVYSGIPRVFNIGSGIGLSLSQLIGSVEQAVGCSIVIDRKPEPVGIIKSNVLDSTKAWQNLDWSPRISLNDGLAETVRWLRSDPILA